MIGTRSLLPALFALILLGCTLAVAGDPASGAKHLDQGWEPGWEIGQTNWYHHASQGTMIVPYDWFMALEQPSLEPTPQPKMFSDSDYLSRFGFLRSEADTKYGKYNPDSLPIGFAIAENWKDPNDKTPSPPLSAVGLTCAACHTSEITYKKHRLRIEGGSAMINLGDFHDALKLSLLITNSSSEKFEAFAKRWLERKRGKLPISDVEAKKLLKKKLEQAVAKGMQRQKLEGELGLHTLKGGFGRTDALARIGNHVFGKLGSMNLTETNAPVNFPHLWDTPWFHWVQYNGSIRLPMVRNIGEALGVGAEVNENFESTVDVTNLHLMEDQVAGNQPFTGLQAPAWPEEVLGEIDGFRHGTGKWKQGKALYEKHCMHCHYRIEDYRSTLNLDVTNERYQQHWSQPNRYGRRYMELPMINFFDIGTDRAAVVDFFTRIVYTGSVDPERPTMSALDALDIATSEVRKRKYAELGLSPAEYAAHDGYREMGLEPAAIARLDYKARPLNGIWATAPFLHNGSVANLYELLLPAEQRMRSFYVGSIELDPKRVGFDTKWGAGFFLMDTTLPGNLNTGHEFRNLTAQERAQLTPFQKQKFAEGESWAVNGVLGPEFRDDERWALIEYLKSLGSPQPAQERPPAGESTAIKKLGQLQTLIQQMTAKKTGKVMRGQHPKSHGIVSARFKVADNLPPWQRVGLFRQPNEYRARIRFSNGESPDDRTSDVHGMAIKVKVPTDADPDNTVDQDFVLADHPVFFAKNVQHLLEFSVAVTRAPDQKTREAVKAKLATTTHPALIGFKKPLNTSPLEATYWSQTPYKFGELAVKYCVIPSPRNAEGQVSIQTAVKQTAAKKAAAKPTALTGCEKGPNFLREAMVKRLTKPNAPATFEFYIQPQTDVQNMPIEDATVEWKSQPIKLATITIDPQTLDPKKQQELEGMSFSPCNSFPEHRPLGGINRARHTIYEASQDMRHRGDPVKKNRG